MQVFGFAGWSGSGKTTLIEKLIACIVAKGVTVSTVKHAHASFDIDRPGKDSHRHRMAGASEVLVSSPQRWALVREPVDLVLVEGFKFASHPKLEVHDPALGKPLLAPEDPNIVAVAWADNAAWVDDRPVFRREDYGEIARFILAYTGLA